MFPPRYPEVVAHHVTLKFPAGEDFPLPDETSGFVIGRADNGENLEALVVEIGGTARAPDGRTFHITWSKAEGVPAHLSNKLISERGFTPLDDRIPISLEPKLMS
jgi:hypothetical protein